MQKMIFLALFAMITSTYFASPLSAQSTKASNLIKNPEFQKNFARWYVPFKSLGKPKVDNLNGENILIIKGFSEDTEKRIRCIQKLDLKKDEIAGQKFKFSVDLRAIKITGKVSFAVREIDSENKTIIYHSIILDKRDKFDWKKFSKTFTASPKATALGIYIIASYLDKDDEVQAKKLHLSKI